MGAASDRIQVGILWVEAQVNILNMSVAAKHAAAKLSQSDDGNITLELMWRLATDTSVEAAMERMVATSEHLIGFVGPTSSDEARFAARIAEQAGLPILSPSATAAQLDDTKWFGFFRRPIASDAYAGEALVALSSLFGFRRGVILFDPSSTYSSGLSIIVAAVARRWDLNCHAVPMSIDEVTANGIEAVRPYLLRLCLGSRQFCLAILRAAESAQPALLDDWAMWMVSESMAIQPKYGSMRWLANVLGV